MAGVPRPERVRTRFAGLTLIDGTGAPARRDMNVEIADGRIAAITAGPPPGPDFGTDAAGTEVVDARGLTLLPGLIDGHVHLLLEPEVNEPGDWDRAQDDDDATLLGRAGVAAARLLATGVTTARDCGGRGGLPVAVRDAIARGTLPGPRILASGPVITRTGGHGHRFGLAADDAPALRRAAAGLLDGGVDFLKIMATGGNLSGGSRPDRPHYSAEELAAVVAEAHRRDRPVTAHAHARSGIANAVEAGVDALEHCSWLGDGGRDYDPALVDRMVGAGLFVDFTPAVSYRLVEGAPAGWSELCARLRRVREIRVPTMVPMWKAGVQFYFGSDAGTPFTFFEDFVLVLELSVLEGGLPAAVVIAAATGTAAQALGIAQETGTIAVGKTADLLFVEGDPLADIRALRNVRRVYRSGQLVVGPGRSAVARRDLAYLPPAVPVTPMG